MSIIRPLAPPVCPQCSGERTFAIKEERIECRRCGYVVRGEGGQPTRPSDELERPAPAERDLSRYTVSYRIDHRGGVEPIVEAIFTTAMDHIARQDWEGGIKHMRRALEYRSDFLDAHLWLGRLLDDPVERRDHLTSVLAEEPSHAETLRELMILDGELDPDGDFDEFTMPEDREAGGAVSTKAANNRCPRCNSPGLSDDEASGEVVCTFCGYRQSRSGAVGALGSFSKAMIKQRSQPVRWVVGDRLLKCQGCGAERTIPATALADSCPFCGSKHVITSDALGTFRQPDGIIPFSIKEADAREKIEARLQNWGERVRSFFIDQRVERTEISGVFIPFWVFDAVIEVQRTTIDQRGTEGVGFGVVRSGVPTYQTETIPEMMNNVLIGAVTSPPAEMTRRLGRFNLKAAVGYQPRMLAQHAAELYSIDFEKAAMDMHEIVGTEMRERHGQTSASSEMQINVFSMIRQMSFRLLLLPVWSVTVFEKDGDVRPALVNGQTGRVVLGRTIKANGKR